MTTTEAPRDLGSDLALRYEWFTRASLAHPAKLHLGLLQLLLDRYTAPGDTVLDPMAGVGSILLAATQQRAVIARELEPRWLALLHENAKRIYERAGLLAASISVGQHDAREPWGVRANHIIFSPPYGCDAQYRPRRLQMLAGRMERIAADNPRMRQRWARVVANADGGTGAAALFAFAYGEHPKQIGPLRGARYWQAMEAVYTHARAALGKGVMILVLKDHIRKGVRIETAAQTIALCERLGFALIARHQRRVHPLSLWQRRRKERGEPVIEEEDALVFRKAGAL